MRTIRYNTFETNSSSTHCITMLDKSDYDHWTNKEIFIDINDGNKVYDLKDVYELLKLKYNYQGFESYSEVSLFIDELIANNNWCRYDCEVPISFDKYCEMYDSLEMDTDYFTTKNGDDIVAICHYGYD